MSTNKVIMGAFKSATAAQGAITELELSGVTPGEISVLLPESAKEDFVRLDKQTKAPEGAAAGGAAGVALGGLVAGLTAIAGVAIPGVGILAAGPLVAALTGAGAGAAIGGSVGGLVGLGLSEHEAKFTTSVLKEGGYIVVVTTENSDRQDTAQDVFDRLAVQSDTSKGRSAVAV